MFGFTMRHRDGNARGMGMIRSLLVSVFLFVAVSAVYAQPYRVHIELDSLPTDIWHAMSPDTLVVSKLDTPITLFAVVRDKYEAFVYVAENPSWANLTEEVISITAHEGTSKAEVTGIDSGLCAVVLSSGNLLSDTVFIHVEVPRHSTFVKVKKSCCDIHYGERITPIDLKGRLLPQMGSPATQMRILPAHLGMRKVVVF